MAGIPMVDQPQDPLYDILTDGDMIDLDADNGLLKIEK